MLGDGNIDNSELVSNDALQSNKPPSVGCTSVHLGQVNASFVGDDHTPTDGTVTPVSYYSAASGTSRTSQARVVTRPDGTKVIITPERDHRKILEQPLTRKRVLIMKILSVIGAVVFPPTGIPAVIFAWKTEKELSEGLMRGDLDKAFKYAKRCERLVIFSFLLGLVMYVLIIALIQKARLGPDEDQSTLSGSL